MSDPILISSNSGHVAGRLSSQGRSTGIVGSRYLIPPLYGQMAFSNLTAGSVIVWPISSWRTWTPATAGWTIVLSTDLNGFTFSGGLLTAMVSGRYRIHHCSSFSCGLASATIFSGVSINGGTPHVASIAREQLPTTTYRSDQMDSSFNVEVAAGDTVGLAVYNQSSSANLNVYEMTFEIVSINL